MGYFEEKMGLPPDEYSDAFLKIDAEAGPWLTQSQQSTPIDRSKFPQWDLDLEEQVIWFGDEQRNGVVAAIQVLGTWDPGNGTWLWAWSNPELSAQAQATAKVHEDHPDVPELCDPSATCSEARAWALAAAAAFTMKSETCYCLPGKLKTFVALFEITALDADDPRARRPSQDPELAQNALAEFIGPAAMHIGAMLTEQLDSLPPQGEEVHLEPVIGALHMCCENLEDLSKSRVGCGTPAAQHALELSQQLRQAAQLISIPVVSPPLIDGLKQVFELLGSIAREHGAWPGNEPADQR